MSAGKSKLTYRGDWTFSVQKSFILCPDISAGAKVVYLAIKSFCSPNEKTAFPSSKTLSKALSMSRDTVLKYSKELQTAELLEATQSVAEKGRFSHTVYVLNEFFDRSGNSPLRRNTVAEKVDTKIPQKTTEEIPVISPPDGEAPPKQPEDEPELKRRHREFTKLWCEEYEQTFGRPYKHGGAKDGAAIKRLLASSGRSPEELLAVARLAWRFPKLFNCKQAASLTGFDSRFNEIVAEVAHLLPKKPATAQPKGGPEDF